MVAIPAGFEKTAPASPTSAAPAPPRPAARVEAGRLTHAPAPDWEARDEIRTALHKSVKPRRPATALPCSTIMRDACAGRSRVTLPLDARGLLGAEVQPRSGSQHVAQVDRAPGAHAGRERECGRDTRVRGRPGSRIRAPVAQQGVIGPKAPHLVLQLEWRREAGAIGHPVRQGPALEQQLERLPRLRRHVLWAREARDVELTGEYAALCE